MEKITTYTRELSPELASKLRGYLESHGFEFRSVPHTVFFAEGPDVTVGYYKSGKLVVQGRGTADFVLYVLEPQILGEVGLGYEEILKPDLYLPRVGIDESGKGDYFGPLCVAAVYVNKEIIRAWEGKGIKDSKHISSDTRIAELARVIRSTPGVVYSVVEIGNAAYNRLHEKLKNVNKILAWGHARALENLLAKQEGMRPPPVRAISDQFSSNKALLERALMAAGRKIEFIQRHGAESDIAVAAASIIARERFVAALRRLSRKYGLVFPPGAGEKVVEVARDFVRQHGSAALVEVAKLHFRITQKVLSEQTDSGSECNGGGAADASATDQSCG